MKNELTFSKNNNHTPNEIIRCLVNICLSQCNNKRNWKKVKEYHCTYQLQLMRVHHKVIQLEFLTFIESSVLIMNKMNVKRD